ncbi:alpha/beta hydrolase [Nonomuraea longicatena]|uniref:Alpha/beta hydrolase n=1 Tax=Nonomuraea longicatena TaxID=83682 RepID=A0ABP3Z4Q0_9ACTN
MILDLPGGRRLGYHVFGDPDGVPCLFVHGYSSSRWAAGWTLGEGEPRRRGIRVVSVDRPGYGLSTPRPGAGFTDWAEDAALLVEPFGRVAVVGVSMGAGPALALAAARPDLVVSATILGGMPPVGARERWAPDSRADALYWRLARHAPALLRGLCAMSTRSMASMARESDGADRLVAAVSRTLPPADLTVFRDLLAREKPQATNQHVTAGEDVRAAFVADVRETCRQGGAAMAEDLLRYLRPWGFEPEDVTVPVHLWHGLEDPKVPVALARRLAGRLPQVTARFVPGGHFAVFAHRAEILDRIAHEGSRRP